MILWSEVLELMHGVSLVSLSAEAAARTGAL